MIEAERLVLRRGGRLVLDEVSLAAHRNTTVGIVGPNGAGNSPCTERWVANPEPSCWTIPTSPT